MGEPNQPNLSQAEQVSQGGEPTVDRGDPFAVPGYNCRWLKLERVRQGFFRGRFWIPVCKNRAKRLTESRKIQSSGPSHHQTDQHGNDGNPQRTLEVLIVHPPSAPLHEAVRKGSKDGTSELEKDMLLAFEEQEKVSALAPSSLRSPYRSLKPSPLKIDREYE